MDRNIYPTGKCFDDALELMMAILKENLDASNRVDRDVWENLYLVHGFTNGMGRPSAHAWLEDDRSGLVCFVGILDGKRENFAVPRDEYYRELKITDTTRYLYDDVLRLNRKHGHYGPWETKYQGFLRDSSVATDYKIDKIAGL